MKFIVSIVLLLCLSSVSEAARLDTSFVFSTIETANFSIHYHQGLETAARRTALIAEEVHVALTGQFSWKPLEKTEIVLIDDSDFTNGYSLAIPYNVIYVQVVPPNLPSTLGQFDDWLRSLITHEYAHIVTLDPARGYWKGVRDLFGKPVPGLDPLSGLLFLVTAPPNSFMPRWWHEGMATWAETEYSRSGRGGSSFYEMIFRMAVAGDNLPTIARINGDVPEWPAGRLPYLYGFRLQKYIADSYGKDGLGKLNIAHAGRFPYLISAPPRELSGGKSYSDLYEDMIAALRREQSQRIEALSAAPFTPFSILSKGGDTNSNPRFSPDGSRLAYTKQDPGEHTTTVITDRSDGTVRAEFRRLNPDGNICWAPDGKRLFFTQPEIHNGFNTYQDLYAYDLERGSITRQTEGQRIGDVDLSPDGRRFAAVVSGRGSQNLALLEMTGSGSVTLPRPVTGYTMERLSSPRWSPDSALIAYALADNGGKSSIHLYDAASGRDRTLFTVDHTAAYPVWSRDGSSLLYVSDETGVFNLFVYDLKEGKSYQASHLLGGALQPDLSPDGREVIFSSYDSHGFSIAQMAFDREKLSVVRSPSLPQTDAAAVPAPTATGAGGSESAAAAAPYSPIRTLLPAFWLPRISGDGSDRAVFGLFTAGTDVLGYNSYALTADYGAGRKRGYFELSYQNDYLYPTLFLQAHQKPLLYANLLQRGDYYELHRGVTLGASVPLNSLESRYRISGGFELREQRALSTLDGNGRFQGVAVFQGRRDNIFAGVGFDNVLRYPYSISSEEGRKVSLLYRRFGRELGNDQELSEYSAEYEEFLRLPVVAQKHQILYLRLAGALADSDRQFGQQSFQIGGIPSELNRYPLRGYPERMVTGKYVATGTLEYRAPLFFPMHGSGTFPAFAEKVHGALFVDAGEVWDGTNGFSGKNVKIGAGAEARMDVTLGYWLKVTPALGVARGFSQGGTSQLYFTVYVDL